MQEITTSNGITYQLDDDDFNFFNQWSWYGEKHGYAKRTISDGSIVRLHVEIAKRCGRYKEGFYVDHKDLDKFNCQRENLRAATYSQSGANRLGSNGLRGVYQDRRSKWISYYAQIKCKGLLYRQGPFNTKDEAAKSYDQLALRLFGESAILNFSETV